MFDWVLNASPWLGQKKYNIRTRKWTFLDIFDISVNIFDISYLKSIFSTLRMTYSNTMILDFGFFFNTSFLNYDRDVFRTLSNIYDGAFCKNSQLRCLTGFWIRLRMWNIEIIEAALQRCSYEKVFWKYAANLQENTHVEMQFQ